MILQKVRDLVKKESINCKRYSSNVWEQHFVVVVKYAKMLAKKLGANEEVCELGALLHDIGSIRFGEENHEVTGQQEAEKILKEIGFSQDIIDQVKECIRTHRGSLNLKPQILEAKIVANADAMAHFDVIPVLLRVGLDKFNRNEKLATKWVLEKLERDYRKKLTIPEAKKIVEERYQAAKLLLS